MLALGGTSVYANRRKKDGDHSKKSSRRHHDRGDKTSRRKKGSDAVDEYSVGDRKRDRRRAQNDSI